MVLIPAIDLGGTLIKGALVTPDGRVAERRSVPTGAAEGWNAVVDRMGALGRAMVQLARDHNGQAPNAIGVTVPGLLDEATGVAIQAVNFDWTNLPIRPLLEQRIGVPIVVSHDVAAGALAEHRFGAAQGAQAAVVAPIGTGIAAGLIYRGVPYRGGHGRIVELGHVPLAWSDEPCGCGRTGCLERVASASAIARRYARLAPAGRPALEAKDVVALALAGDPVALPVWQDAIRALGEGFARLVTLLDPDRIVIGGGLSQAGEDLLAPLRQAIQGLLTFQVMPQVVQASLGSDAGVVGAAIGAGL
ncbi:MAG: ROK family protein [Bifidobacteriaceae bacterium]|jgi:glucokinase|nr:ROK family protein [Bifidobacteriaceae bacterium]